MFPPSRIIYLTEETVETLYYTITFRARCSGLILHCTKLRSLTLPLLVKDHYQNAGHDIDQMSAYRDLRRALARAPDNGDRASFTPSRPRT
jgi:hypothetical protein